MSRSSDRPLVVVTDHGFPDLAQERAVLASTGARLEVAPAASGSGLAAAVRDADALLVQFARIDAHLVAQLRRCRVIVRYGIGVDTIDLDAAAQRGIAVVNVPDYALDEVADHALALLLASARRLVRVALQVRAGTWDLSPCRPLRSLSSMTLGLAGFGAIARRVASRAQALGMRVVAFDPFVDTEDFAQASVTPVDWDGLLEGSDVISVHLPLTEATHHLFGAAAFATMRPGVVFVNTSRGAVVDTGALLDALRSGRVAAVGLDVLETEPPADDDPLVHHPNAIVTSHCAWYSEESLQRLQRLAAEEVARALRGERPRHVVNRPRARGETSG